MWKTLVAGATMLTIASSTLATAQQPSPAARSHIANLTADDIAAFSDARIAALKAALMLTPAQEKNWPAVEQALRDMSRERIAQREAPATVRQDADATERLRNRANALTNRAAALGAWLTPRNRCTRVSTRRRSVVSTWDRALWRVGIARRLTPKAETQANILAERYVTTSPCVCLGRRGELHPVARFFSVRRRSKFCRTSFRSYFMLVSMLVLADTFVTARFTRTTHATFAAKAIRPM